MGGNSCPNIGGDRVSAAVRGIGEDFPTIRPASFGDPLSKSQTKTHHGTIIIIFAEISFQRGNAATITAELRNTGTFELRLPRKPCYAVTFIQHNRALLRPDQDAKIHNEIDWGTSTSPRISRCVNNFNQIRFF